MVFKYIFYILDNQIIVSAGAPVVVSFVVLNFGHAD